MSKEMKTWVDAMKIAEPKFKEINKAVGAVDWVREASFARQIIQAAAALQKCPPQTVYDAVVNVAAVGLTLNPAEKLAYLVPRDGKCVLDISYRGLLKIATDTGSIMWGMPELVYEGDDFTYKGPATKPEHDADVFAENRGTDEGLKGGYCIAKTKECDYLVTTMTAKEIFEVRRCSKAYMMYASKKGEEWKAGPWVTFFGEMAKKTLIKRAQKVWPRTDKTQRLDHAIHLLNQHEGLSFTDEQLDFYSRQVEKSDDPLEFMAFTKSLDSRVHNDLFNHWEYGDKTKMKQKARDLESKAWEIVHSIVVGIKQAVENDDDGAVRELLDDLSFNARGIIIDNLDAQSVDYCKHIGYEEAA